MTRKIDALTLDDIRTAHPGCVVQAFDAGDQLDEVLVWRSEEDATNDDGANAVARYLVKR